jgi:hypothetical protein
LTLESQGVDYLSRVATTFLFSNPSFFSGVARLLDFEGAFDSYNHSRSPIEADTKAMHVDWAIVGESLVEALGHLEVELKGEQKE